MKTKKITFIILVLISINIKAFSQTNHLRNSVSLEFFNSIMTTVAAPLVLNNGMYFLLDNLKMNNFVYNFEENIHFKFSTTIVGHPINIDERFKLEVPVEIDIKNEVIRPSIEKNIFYGKGAAKINYCFDISKKIVLNIDTGILVWNVKFDRKFEKYQDIDISDTVMGLMTADAIGKGIFDVHFNYDANLYVIPIALGVRFYLNRNEYAHGFYIMPKFGATITVLDERFIFDIYSKGNADITIKGLQILPPNDTFKTNITLGASSGYKDGGLRTQFGVYVSAELGWRIRLFPSKYTVWRVRPFIDFSLFEVGYYLNSYVNEGWGLGQLGKLMNTTFFEEWGFLLNFKVLPIPRIAIGITF